MKSKPNKSKATTPPFESQCSVAIDLNMDGINRLNANLKQQHLQLQQHCIGSNLNDEINIHMEYDKSKIQSSSSITAIANEINSFSQSDPCEVVRKSIASNMRKPHQSMLSNNVNGNINTNTNSNSNSNTNNGSRKSKRRRNSDTSSEEERWLTAIESGKLEQVEIVELKRIKDPKLMTARQRAIYDRSNDNENSTSQFNELLIALPIGYKEKEKPQTVEEIKKAQLKSLKRKQLADEKREKDKRRTMERLLRKQETRQRSANKLKSLKGIQPVIRYRHTINNGGIIQMPHGIDFPLKRQTPKEPPNKILCAIAGCGRHKVYNCSKTNLPLCSYECYRKNVLSLKKIMC